MGRFLVESGQRFELKQKASAKQGHGRTYPVLLAFENASMKRCFDRMFDALHQDASMAIDPTNVDASLRLLGFTMLSSGMTAMHALLRLPRSQFPYALFELISPNKDPQQTAQRLVKIPKCMHDDLFRMILARYPSPEDLTSKECLTVIESLAQLFAVDIAAIEARHSTNRDFSLLRSKGWITSLETVSARFNIQHFGFQSASKSRSKKGCESQSPRVQAPRVRKKKGGGGGLRAYISVRSRGKKGKPDFQKLAREYALLSNDEKQEYKSIGRAGTLAHKHGHAAFGKIKRKRSNKLVSKFQQNRALLLESVEKESAIMLPGDCTESGAIVALDADQSLVQSFDQHMSKQTLQLQCMRESFAEKYQEFLDSLDDEVQDPLALSPDDQNALQSLEEASLVEPTVTHLQQEGHAFVAENLKLESSASGRASFLRWKTPAPHAVQARHEHMAISMLLMFIVNQIQAHDVISLSM